MLEKPFGAGEGASPGDFGRRVKNLRLRVCPLGLSVELSEAKPSYWQSLLFGHTRNLLVFLSSGAESRQPFIRSEYVLHPFSFQILQNEVPELNG